MANKMQHHASNDMNCANCLKLEQKIVALEDALAEMEQHAYQDALTGISNLRFFIENLENRIARCRRYGENCALMFLDVNNLKAVNDQYGHAAGDTLLMRMAEILHNHTRSTDVAARIGGDEFGLLLDNLDSDQVVDKIAFFLEQFAAVNCTHEGRRLPFGAAIGYCFVGPKDTIEGLMSRADAAMYRAKDKPQ